MSRLRVAAARLRALLLRRARGDDEELRFHVDMLEADLRRSGLDPVEARRQARIAFGGVRQAAEARDDQRSLPLAENAIQDLAYGIRTLSRAPGFTLAAILTLALGFGGNIGVFSLVDAVLLRPLPYPAPDRIVMVEERGAARVSGNVGFATIDDLRAASASFERIEAIRSWSPTLVAGGEAERLDALRVSAGYFTLLGVRPALGRDFTADDDHPDRWHVLILSDGLWRRRFGGRADVIGQTVRMNDQDYRIVGVLPPAFEPLVSGHVYRAAEMWAPLGYDASLPYGCRSCRHLKAIGRLRPGVAAADAALDLTRIRDGLRAAHPGDYAPGRIAVTPLHDMLAAPLRPLLLVLLAAVAVLLVIACANVANLLLARGLSRAREIHVRLALGATRARIVRQLLTEGLLLSALGAAAGAGLAAIAAGALPRLLPLALPATPRAAAGADVLGFTAALTVLAGLTFAWLPARRVSAASGGLILRHGRTVTAGPGALRRALAVTALALSLVLVSAAGLMLRSLTRLARVDPGFDPRGVLTLQFSLIGERYREDDAVRAFQRRLLDEVAALPGVEQAALAGQIPMGGNQDRWGFHVVGGPPASPDDDAERYSVTPAYLRTLGVPVLRGRGLADEDDERAAPVALVSRAAASRFFPDTDPLGRQIRIGPPNAPARTVVGVVGDVDHAHLDEPAWPQVYVPQAQLTDSYLVLVVRAAGDRPESLLPVLRAAIRRQDSSVPVYDVAPLAALVERSFADRRAARSLLTVFAGLALLLASVGLYGVTSYTVAQRRREIGVRLALGAGRAEILRLVLGSGLRTVGAGLVLGLAGTLLLAPALESLLYGVPPADPMTLVLAAALLAAVAAAAHWIPVRSALHVDPVAILREE